MIVIADNLEIDESEIHEDFIRSSGPGGQHVNKVSTAVQLRFDVEHSASLPDDVRQRLKKLAGKRITGDGELVITARRYRSQVRNREDAMNRLIALIQKANEKPAPRKKRKPSLITKQRRLAEKRHRSKIKQMRKFDPDKEK